jgi:hypothetical protein
MPDLISLRGAIENATSIRAIVSETLNKRVDGRVGFVLGAVSKRRHPCWFKYNKCKDSKAL